MKLYHASPEKFRILKPAKPASFSKRKLVHDSVVWFAKRLDYTIFMVLFRCVEEEYPGKYRFFDWRKKALFYPDKYGPLAENPALFKELYQRAQELRLAKSCKVYVHEVADLPGDLKKSKWGDYYTREQVKVAKILEVVDGVKYLKEKGPSINPSTVSSGRSNRSGQGWDIRILTH